MATNSDAVLEAIQALRSILEKHMSDEEEELKALRLEVLSGFPDGDPDGHRKVHAAWIEKAEKEAQFWEKMRFELVKWGLFGFLGWAAFQLWVGFLHGPDK